MKEGYSVCLNEWALDKDIKNELGLLLIISSLCAKEGYCYASNKYFAELFDTNETLISRKIKKLEEKNYIFIEYEKNGFQIISRKIRLSKMITGLSKTIPDHYLKSQSTIIENDKENNISINNISNNNILSSSSTPNTEIYKKIIDYLNQKLNTNYKYTTTATQSKIKARMNEGFSLNDFKTVIDKMTDEWLDDENMSKYLRPETLFGTKFESYLNMTPKPKKVDPYYNPEAEKEFYESDYYKEHVLGIKVPKKRVIEEGDPFAEYYDN